MTRKYLYLILAVLIGATSCSREEAPIIDEEGLLPKPTASFTYELTDPKDPFSFKFINSSNNSVENRWSFDDNSTSADSSPEHTFLTTGRYNVKLVTLNEEGYWAQREEIIEITANDLVELSASPSGGVLNLSYETSMDIASTTWYAKLDGSFKKVSEEETLSLTVPAGQFVESYVELKTPKGSVTRLNMTLTNVGIVKDLTNYENIFSVSHDNDGGKDAGEGSSKLIDNNIDTKFLIFRVNEIGGPFHWQFDYIERQVINGYTITTGNDAKERDPMDWDLLASNDGENWVTLHSINGYMFPDTGGPTNNGRKATYTFTFDNGTAYHLYKFQVRAVRSATLFQMGEFRMLQLPQ